MRSILDRRVLIILSAAIVPTIAPQDTVQSAEDPTANVPTIADLEDGVRIAPEDTIAELEWLAGTWAGEMWGGRFIAHYGRPTDGKVLSYSKLIREGKESYFEFEVFEADQHLVHLRPFPGGRVADELRMRVHYPAEQRVVFENPGKDFPTRITYHRTAEDVLEIVLSDPHGTSGKVERFVLRADV